MPKAPSMTDSVALPFSLPNRPKVTQIRKRDAAELKAPGRERTQPMDGFEPHFTDIVDYIVRITEEIWVDRAVGRIYDTYDHACTIYSHYGVVRSVEEVIASTVTTLNGFPDGEPHHVNVAWSGDSAVGFYTSHLGFSRSTNLGRSAYGPATGAKVGLHFAADCVSKDNLIHTEWLVRDNGALVRQLGFDPDNVARDIAERGNTRNRFVNSPETRLVGQTPRAPLDIDAGTPEGYVRTLFHDIWNLRRLDRMADHYDADMILHAGGGREAQGLRNASALYLSVMAAIPDGVMRVQNVCWSEETDGPILAVRWLLEGSSARGGVLGDAVPVGRPVAMMGVSHLRFEGGRIVEEWMIFDEIGVMAQAWSD
ncbi:ester cyclase [Rhodobacteraceae bacterium N5(2021)]|uniref:Ester cyclase n=2 Tax=Gymnodinialimonas phycosphaerae TaxID=2841589 RepID=A0ABS7MTV8_9RHOB|nr:ester cyclase [Gymnodinialimonas phycosphaerae]MBY4893546.1 ester cyclase [Gymnodinialimonas phycosphaerae]